MRNVVVRLLRHCAGATAIEYAIMASLIAGAIFSTIVPIAQPLNNAFSTVSSHL